MPCACFVVFSTDCTQTVLVETPRGNLSFPKGKREKGETDMVAALRELEEETGLTQFVDHRFYLSSDKDLE